MSLLGNMYSCDSKYLTSDDISDTFKNPATEDLNMNSFNITDCPGIVYNPAIVDINANNKNVTNVNSVNLASTGSKTINFGDHALAYDATTNELTFNGNTISTASDNVHVVQNPMQSNLDANHKNISNVGDLTGSSVGVESVTANTVGCNIVTATEINELVTVNFKNSDNMTSLFSTPRWNWGQSNGGTFTLDTWAVDQNGNQKTLSNIANVHSTGITSTDIITATQSVEHLRFPGAPGLTLQAASSNRLQWGDQIVTLSTWSENQNANNKSLTDASYIAFNPSGTKQLTANSSGQLMWDGNVVHGGGATSGVQNPMTENLSGGNFNVTDVANLGATQVHTTTVNFGDVNSITTLFDLPRWRWGESGAGTFTLNNWAVDQNANAHAITDAERITFSPSNSKNLTCNAQGELLWDNNVIHSGGAASGVQNPMNATLNAAGYNITNAQIYSFNTGDELSVSADPNDPSRQQLLFDGTQVAVYKPAQGDSWGLTLSNTTVPYGFPLNKNWTASIATPTWGYFNYQIKIILTFTDRFIPADTAGFIRLYASETTTGTVNETPGGDIKLADLQSAKWTVTKLGSSGCTWATTVNLGPTAALSTPGITTTGWNPATVPSSHDKIVIGMNFETDYTGASTLSGKSVFIQRTPINNTIALSGSSGLGGMLDISSDHALTYNNENILTNITTSYLSTSSDEYHSIASFITSSDTAGLLSCKAFNENSCFTADTFCKNVGGNLTIDGSLVHKLSGTTEDLTFYSSDNVVHLAVKGLGNWKCSHTYDTVNID